MDALVLCARFFRSRRAVTAEGFEHNLALFYLSRFLLGHGLVDAMERAQQPVVVNVAGPARTRSTSAGTTSGSPATTTVSPP